MANPINPKVTAATAAGMAVALVCGTIEWLCNVDIPNGLEALAAGLATFAAGYLKSEGGRHARTGN